MPMDPTDPIALLIASHDAMAAAGLTVAVYGGLALAAFGTPRETRDADLAVTGLDGPQALAALKAAGLDVAAGFDRVRFGGNLITRIAVLGGTELNTVDLVLPRSARFAAAVHERSIVGELRGHPLRVVSPEDFVLLKVLSTRDRDLEDARAVLASLAGQLDDELIEREAPLLAAEIPDHDVAGRFAAVRSRG